MNLKQNFVREYLDVEVMLKDAFKIGPKKCIIEVESFEGKIQILIK